MAKIFNLQSKYHRQQSLYRPIICATLANSNKILISLKVAKSYGNRLLNNFVNRKIISNRDVAEAIGFHNMAANGRRYMPSGQVKKLTPKPQIML